MVEELLLKLDDCFLAFSTRCLLRRNIFFKSTLLANNAHRNKQDFESVELHLNITKRILCLLDIK